MRSDAETTGELLLLIPTSTPTHTRPMVGEASRIIGLRRSRTWNVFDVQKESRLCFERMMIRCTNGSKSVTGLGATVRVFKAVVDSHIFKNKKILARIPVIFQDDLAQLTGDVPLFKHADGKAK